MSTKTETIRETLPYSNYEITGRHRSKIDRRYWRQATVGFKCPACKKVHPPIEHGQSMQCDCGLRMTRHGNSLECEKDTP